MKTAIKTLIFAAGIAFSAPQAKADEILHVSTYDNWPCWYFQTQAYGAEWLVVNTSINKVTYTELSRLWGYHLATPGGAPAKGFTIEAFDTDPTCGANSISNLGQ